jgi:hypothetical protein
VGMIFVVDINVVAIINYLQGAFKRTNFLLPLPLNQIIPLYEFF